MVKKNGYIPKFGKKTKLGGGFKHICFHPYLEKIPILTNIFQMGWNHQLENKSFQFISVWFYHRKNLWLGMAWKMKKPFVLSRDLAIFQYNNWLFKPCLSIIVMEFLVPFLRDWPGRIPGRSISSLEDYYSNYSI